MENIWWNFHHLKIDPIELICLKAIVLFRFGKKKNTSRRFPHRFFSIVRSSKITG